MAVNEFVFNAIFFDTIVVDAKVFLVAISISYNAAPVEDHLKIELSATELALFAGERSVGAPAIAVVKLHTDDQLLLATSLFAFTLQ